MPLLELKSNLSKVNTNFGSDTTTAGNTTSFSYDSLDVSPQPNQIDLQYSTTPISNRVSSYAIPMPTITTTTIQAQTQQESGNLFGGGIPPVQINLVEPITISNAHPLRPYKPDVVPPSRLLSLHQKGRKSDLGFTRSSLPLQDYYNQLSKDTNLLGIRNDRISQVGAEQPYVIKDIGDRWGFDGIEQIPGFKNNTIAEVLDFAGLVINEIGGAVLGRSPNEYVGNAIGNLNRMGKFLLTPRGIGFLARQQELKSRNPQKYRTDVRYDVFDDPSLKANDSPSKAANEFKKFESIRKYNIVSLGSLPGVTKININKYDENMILEPYLDTLASMISTMAREKANEIKADIITIYRDSIQPVIKGALNTAASYLPQGVTTSVGNLVKRGKGLAAQRKSFLSFASDFKNEVSKLQSLKINPQAKVLSQVGVDKVNLVPYGKYTEEERVKNDELDFIPFRFEDSEGNQIVFRAILSGITDAFTPEYSSERYIGRPDNVYVYMGTQREINFTFDIYPKSDQELVTLWEKMNYLAGLTYPSWAPASGGGQSMIAPFSKLTIGQMYTNTSGYISSLTYTVMDEGTWETTFAKLPKYIQASCTFVYVGDRLPSSTQKHYELPWVAEKQYVGGISEKFNQMLGERRGNPLANIGDLLQTNPTQLASFLDKG